MEMIDAGALVPGPAERTVLVAHSRTGLRRGLDLGEAVLLRAPDGEYHVARVVDLTFELDDTVYTCELGGRIPEELARERAAGLDPDRDDLELHEIVDLLHELRDEGHRPPDAQAFTRQLAMR
ncbi:hypothetical protein [Nocardioides aquiterrae]